MSQDIGIQQAEGIANVIHTASTLATNHPAQLAGLKLLLLELALPSMGNKGKATSLIAGGLLQIVEGFEHQNSTAMATEQPVTETAGMGAKDQAIS